MYNHLSLSPTGSLYIYTNYVLAEDLGRAKGGPLLKKIIKVIASATAGEVSRIETSEIAKKIGKPQNYLEFYIEQLTKYDLIKKVDRGLYEMVDQVIARCIAKNNEIY